MKNSVDATTQTLITAEMGLIVSDAEKEDRTALLKLDWTPEGPFPENHAVALQTWECDSQDRLVRRCIESIHRQDRTDPASVVIHHCQQFYRNEKNSFVLF